jgi:hypothetical protein
MTIKEIVPQHSTMTLVLVTQLYAEKCIYLHKFHLLQVSRGGQTVTLVGTTLVLFGGEDAERCLLNDLHILDLETMTWDDVDAM